MREEKEIGQMKRDKSEKPVGVTRTKAKATKRAKGQDQILGQIKPPTKGQSKRGGKKMTMKREINDGCRGEKSGESKQPTGGETECQKVLRQKKQKNRGV